MLVGSRMIRSLLRLSAAVSFAFLVPGLPSAAPSGGLQYDEIVRVVVSATPPPPGSFQADLGALASPAPLAATAAPRGHRGFGNLGALASGVLSGNVAGAIGGAATDAVIGNALDSQADRIVGQTAGIFAGALRGLTQGRLERHSFYSGWERIDDVSAQTATITKCDLHKTIKLDLAKKTYMETDTAAAHSDTAMPVPKAHRGSAPAPEQPGTAVADFTNVVTALGSQKLDSLDTSGYENTSTFAVSQATGSCRNGNFAFHTKTYYSRLAQPRLVCPLSDPPARQRYPQEPANFVASGGCRPTYSAHRSGPQPPAQNLSLYQTIAMTAPSGATAPTVGSPSSPAPGFLFLTERGNVHTLTAANGSLFEIPADFTRVP